MRTTLNLDDDLLFAIKELAKRESRSAGAVASDLIRRSLDRSSSHSLPSTEDEAILGFEPFRDSREIVTDELVNQIRDEIGI